MVINKLLTKSLRQVMATVITLIWSIYLLYYNLYFDFFIIAAMYLVQSIFHSKSLTIEINYKYIASLTVLIIGYLLIFSIIKIDYVVEMESFKRIAGSSSLFIILIIFFIFIFHLVNDLIGSHKK